MNVQDDMDVHEFVELNMKRKLAVKSGEDDMAPGMYWSASCGDPLFLMKLQKIGHDRWDEIGVREYLMFLHIGSEKPN